ncbi:hypothetical protein BC831DRAFT_396122 [Entophlyctis helioformis]|nr:hypothetical protein BC831DRAFT_396122 [Entophlyctis helioformis]
MRRVFTGASLLAAVLAVLCIFPQTSLDIFQESLFQHYRLVQQDPFLDIPKPRIVWVDPASLVRHEYTSRPHLESLLQYLQSLPPSSMVPIPVVTVSSPRVILDGHHRVAASRILGLKRIPVWEVDDADELGNWDTTLVRCYSRANGLRMPLSEVTGRARGGSIDWGIKGTRHVVFLQSSSSQQTGSMSNPRHIELALERVTPRIEWRLWLRGGPLQDTESHSRQEDSIGTWLPSDTVVAAA